MKVREALRATPFVFLAVICAVVLVGAIWIVPASGKRPSRESATSGGACSMSRSGMVCVPAGHFTMGSHQGDRDEEPPHRVWVDEFLIDKHEVTFGEYNRCVKAGRCAKPQYSILAKKSDENKNKKRVAKKGKKGKGLAASKVKVSVNPKFPVVGVDWQNAQKYCSSLGKRLPTEAEWEKAARNGDGRRYPWGKTPPTCKKANIAACRNGIEEVGKHPEGKSPYGAMDMTGNVWEWVYDWYDANFYKKPAASRNPFGPLQSFDPISQKPQYRYKVLRGGSYTGSPSPLWTSYRFRLLPNTRSNDIGFRCVLSKVKAPAQPKPPKARLAEDEAAVPGTDSEPSSGSTTENE